MQMFFFTFPLISDSNVDTVLVLLFVSFDVFYPGTITPLRALLQVVL